MKTMNISVEIHVTNGRSGDDLVEARRVIEVPTSPDLMSDPGIKDPTSDYIEDAFSIALKNAIDAFLAAVADPGEEEG